MKNSPNNKKTGINPLEKLLVCIIGDEKRQKITVPLLAIFLSLLASSIILIMLGTSPIDTFASFLKGSGLLAKENYSNQRNMFTDFMSFINAWTPMLLAALSVAVALRSGLFNIGVSGQMLASALVTTALVGYTELPAVIAKPLVIIIAMVVGGLVGGLIGILKHKWKISEVVSAIMINYIVRYIASFFIKTSLLDNISRQSRMISENARLTLLNQELFGLKMDIPLGIILAFIAVFAIDFLFKKMKIGFEFNAIGLNPLAAKYSGMKVGENIFITMAISGALAGLAGATYFMGYYGTMQPDTLISTGFDAVAVSILGNSTPLGIVFSSFFITVIDRGSIYMQSSVGVRQEIASLITGMVLLFSACGIYISMKVNQIRQKELDYIKFHTAETKKEEGKS